VALVDAATGELVEEPDFLARGLVLEGLDTAEVVPRIREALSRAAADDVGEAHQLEQLIARTVARWAERRYRRRPMIIPVVVEV